MPKMSLTFTADDLTPEQISALLTKLKIQKKSDYRKDTQPVVQVSYCMGDVIEFNSGRKCSSVFVELQNGTQRMYMKDTDAMMLPLLRSDISHGPIYATLDHMLVFANKGLRTLVVAWKGIPRNASFSAWEHC